MKQINKLIYLVGLFTVACVTVELIKTVSKKSETQRLEPTITEKDDGIYYEVVIPIKSGVH